MSLYGYIEFAITKFLLSCTCVRFYIFDNASVLSYRMFSRPPLSFLRLAFSVQCSVFSVQCSVFNFFSSFWKISTFSISKIQELVLNSIHISKFRHISFVFHSLSHICFSFPFSFSLLSSLHLSSSFCQLISISIPQSI